MQFLKVTLTSASATASSTSEPGRNVRPDITPDKERNIKRLRILYMNLKTFIGLFLSNYLSVRFHFSLTFYQ